MLVFCTTCKGRTPHIMETLPVNIRDNRLPDSRFVLLNYNSPDGLLDYVTTHHREDIRSGKLVVYTHPANGSFHVAHAKNMAARCAIREGADILVTLDADNFTGPDFDRYILERMREPGVFLCPDHVGIREIPHGPERPCRGFAGRLAVRAQDFIKAGGYDEAYDTWRGEDIDFNARMSRMGYTMRFIENRYLNTIPHNAEVRFKEYPHARQYDRHGAWKIEGNHNNTVVNFGQLGLGTVYRNGDATPIELTPVPTRVFGIGLQKTATNSLHKAFGILGFDSFHWGEGESPLIWYEMQATGRSKTLEKYYSLCDLPIPLLYKELDKAYPGSKFILTVRDEEKWIKSVERMFDPAYNATRWMWDVYPFSNTIHKALYGRTDFDAETMLNRYRRHNAEVYEYFKGRTDLVSFPTDGMPSEALWGLLCGLLDCPIPNVPYPHEYPTKLLWDKCSTGIEEESEMTGIDRYFKENPNAL
jgi:hypothetical protein